MTAVGFPKSSSDKGITVPVELAQMPVQLMSDCSRVDGTEPGIFHYPVILWSLGEALVADF